MSAAAAPWSVKGIDPKAREIAKDLARRSGMTLGEWLNSMIMDEPEEDQGVTTLPRRSPIPDPYDRRARSRRLDDAYDGPSLDVIADRLEAAERRSAEAIRSIEDAVAGLVRRIDRQEGLQGTLNHRIDTVADELRDGHQRLKRVEQSDAGEGRLQRVSERLDDAQIQTQSALKALERSFANLDDRLRHAENQGEGGEGGREISRFERLAETLSRQVEGNRVDMMRRLDVVEIENRADRIERALASVSEQSLKAEQKSAAAVEAMGREVMRIAQNINTRIERVEAGDHIQALGQTLSDKLERDLDRHAQAVDQRLSLSDEHHARAIERLGNEITRISDRLSDRIADSERRSAEAIDDIGRRMAEHSERTEQRHTVSSELADRMRQSEERTAQLLAEARDAMEQRAPRPALDASALQSLSDFPFITTATSALSASAPVEDQAVSTYEPTFAAYGNEGDAPAAAPEVRAQAEAQAWTPAEAPKSDWRAAAFGDVGDIWSDDDLDGLLDAAPFPSARAEAEAAHPAQVEAPSDTVQVFADPLEAELNAWVDARSRDAAPASPFASLSERSEFGTVTAPAEADVDAGLDDDLSGVLDDLLVSDIDVTVADPEPEALELDETAQALPSFDDFMDRPLTLPGDEGSEAVAQAQAQAETPVTAEADDEPLSLLDQELNNRLSTREALDAARAAMVEGEEPVRQGFGFKRKGGKSKLQERLDKQARGEGGNIRKAFGASVLAALVVGGGYGFLELSDANGLGTGAQGKPATSKGGAGGAGSEPIAAMALAVAPTDATPSTDVAATEGAGLFDRAVELLDKGDDRGTEALTRAAELGHAGAQLRLAGLYQDGGGGIEPDPVEARNWARRAAEGGDARAMHFYAMQLYDGSGGAQNRSGALGWLRRAAEAGRVDSQYNVARLYEVGDVGVPKNPQEAFTWYMIAARRGDQQALAAVQRLTPTTDAQVRRKAREAADAFNVDPVA